MMYLAALREMENRQDNELFVKYGAEYRICRQREDLALCNSG
jgi:hypothetical protein